MTKEVNKKQTLGRFDLVGNIAIDSKVFALNTPGKNNANWISNTFNPKIEGANGQSMFVRISDGYDAVKGKKIFARSQNDTPLEISFADRRTQSIVDMVDERSFIKVAVDKVTMKNDNGTKYKAWNFQKFLTVYDAIEYLTQVMPLASKLKVRMVGDLKYSEYNGSLQRNFELKTLYILTGNEEEGKELPCDFKFTQNVILTKDAVDMSEFESTGVAKVKTKLYVKKPKVKDAYQLLELPLLVRATEENKVKYSKILPKYFQVGEDVVRRINIEGVFNVGYTTGQIDENDLPAEAIELIEDMILTKEEVLKMYAKKDRVDELLIRKPVAKMTDDGIKLDYSDTDYTMEDITLASAGLPEGETVNTSSNESVDDLLNELEGL